jgi:hypothetical protein
MDEPDGLSRDVQKSEGKSREFNIVGPFLRPLVRAPLLDRIWS